MRVLSLSSVYPNQQEPGLGLFVQSRLAQLAQLVEVKVVAPIPALDYSHPRGSWIRVRDVPRTRVDKVGEVLYPRWIFPPGGTPVNVLCLAAQLIPVLSRLRRRFAFNLIDAHFGYPEGATAALLARWFRTPYIVTLRGNEPAFAAALFRRIPMALSLRSARAVITVSSELARFAGELGAAADRIHVIPNGIDTDLFCPRDRETCRRALGVAPNTKLIVCAGELIEAKGHHLAIRAVAELISCGKDVHMVIAGGTARGGRPYHRELEALIGCLGVGARVQLAGPVARSEMAELLNAADVFALPSYSEGCPNVVLEAMACGTPVVASDVGGLPEMLGSTRHGMLVPVRDQEQLTKALAKAIDIQWDRTSISIHGRARPWSAVGREVLKIIEESCVASAESSITIPAA